MHSLTRRLQVLPDDDRNERLATEALARKVSVGEVVREAIDARLPPRWSAKGEAAALILQAEP